MTKEINALRFALVLLARRFQINETIEINTDHIAEAIGALSHVIDTITNKGSRYDDPLRPVAISVEVAQFEALIENLEPWSLA